MGECFRKSANAVLGIASAVSVLTATESARANAQVVTATANVSALSAANVSTTSALRLHVVNSADKPIPTAEIRVSLGHNVATGRTDSVGVFRIDGLRTGEWHASVRRIGFKETSVDFHLLAGDNVYTIAVDEIPAALTDVKVVAARTVSIRLRDFEARAARGEPSALVTRKEIEKRNPVKLSQLLRGMPGIQVTDQSGSKIAVAARGAVPGKGTVVNCPLRMAVDGMLRPPGSDLDEILPVDVHGVEVYYGPGRLPPQLANFRTDNWCGLIAIWTRDR